MPATFQRNGVHALLLFGSVAAIVSLVAIGLGWQSSAHLRKLLNHGAAVWGEITTLERRGASRGADQCVAKYRYQDSAGHLHLSEKFQSLSAWEQLRVGDRIPITYLPTKPSIHVAAHLTEQTVFQPLHASLEFAMATMGITLAFSLLALFLLRHISRP